MQLAQGRKSLVTISLIPLVDVMLILLVFFMVTSTYLNLDMVEVAERSEETAQPAVSESQTQSAKTFLIRLNSDGAPVHRGQVMSLGSLALQIKAQLEDNQAVPVVILPSRNATLQSLVTTMEVISEAGGAPVRVVRLEAEK